MNKLVKEALLFFRKIPLLIESRFDKEFLAPDVSSPKMVAHHQWQQYLDEIGNRKNMKILEIGSKLHLKSPDVV